MAILCWAAKNSLHSTPRNPYNYKKKANKEKSANHRILAMGGGGGGGELAKKKK